MSNKYLEKAAEMYQVRPHSDDKEYLGIKHVNLSKQDYEKYHQAKGLHTGVSLGAMAAAGYAGGKVGTSLVEGAYRKSLQSIPNGATRASLLAGKRLNKFTAGVIGASMGVTLAGKITRRIDHDKRMANAGFSAVHSKKDND